MEPIEQYKEAISIRDEMLMEYTSNGNRVDQGFQSNQESKKEIDNRMKGYASIDFLIRREDRKNMIKEIVDLLTKQEGAIKKAGLYTEYGCSKYEDDPENYEIIEVAIQLNKGDYSILRRALSDNEEDIMRNLKKPEQLFEEDKRVESIMGRRHY